MDLKKDFSIYFNTDKEFDVILGKTSYYISMQNFIGKLVSSYSPLYLIEFGSGSGHMSNMLASENKSTSIVAVDYRESVISACRQNKEYSKNKNLTFVHGDLTNLDNFNLLNVDVVLLSYSFNYIPDPLENKTDFLSRLFDKMHKGARIIIGDWFLNDVKSNDQEDIKKLYKLRMNEGAKSIFWNTLTGQDEDDIEIAHKKFNEYKKHHKKILNKLLKREDIFPTSKKWLIDVATQIGFTVEVENYINNINDAVIVLQR